MYSCDQLLMLCESNNNFVMAVFLCSVQTIFQVTYRNVKIVPIWHLLFFFCFCHISLLQKNLKKKNHLWAHHKGCTNTLLWLWFYLKCFSLIKCEKKARCTLPPSTGNCGFINMHDYANMTGNRSRPPTLLAFSFTGEQVVHIRIAKQKNLLCTKIVCQQIFQSVMCKRFYVTVYVCMYISTIPKTMTVSTTVAPEFAMVHWHPHKTSDLRNI